MIIDYGYDTCMLQDFLRKKKKERHSRSNHPSYKYQEIKENLSSENDTLFKSGFSYIIFVTFLFLFNYFSGIFIYKESLEVFTLPTCKKMGNLIFPLI